MKRKVDGTIREAFVAPVRGRGLKLFIVHWCRCACCRPRAGAWIETSNCCSVKAKNTVAPVRGRGLKHPY